MDYQATTPVDPRVLEAMLPYFGERFGNAASRTHVFGWEAEEGVTRAREQIAALIGAHAKEIVVTSGATESNNLAIKGVLAFYQDKGNHVVTVATEHKAVLDPLKALERTGVATVTRVKPRRDGIVDPADIRAAITDKTVLVTVMHANNEIGVIAPIAAIGRIAREAGALFHCDAAQSVGKVPVDVDAMAIDLLSISAHKIYGPKGVGALYVRAREPRVRLIPIIDGGGHERGMRSGTLNVPGVVGLGAASEIAGSEMGAESETLLKLRERLRERLLSELDETYVNGSLESRLPGNLNLSFGYVEGESLLMGLKDIGAVVGIGVYVGVSGAVARAACDRRQRRARPQLDPLRARALHDGGRSGLRGRPRHRRGETAAAPVAALRGPPAAPRGFRSGQHERTLRA
jgi:cysteine desulfurase